MARPKGSKNKKTSRTQTRAEPAFDPKAELVAMYRALKPTAKNMPQRFQILKLLVSGD